MLTCKQPYYRDELTEIYQGDCRDVLRSLPAHSVDMVMTSPPYYGLRKYQAPDAVFGGENQHEHVWDIKELKHHTGTNAGTKQMTNRVGESNNNLKSESGSCSICGAWRGQLGAEPSPDLFIQHLCDIFDDVKRVLKKTGVLFVNIDDSHNSAASNQSGNLGNSEALADIGSRGKQINNIPAKSLIAIPERFVLEMMKRGWIRRNTIIWHKPSCMPESVKDRFTIDFEYLYMFSQSQKYYFEQQFDKSEWFDKDKRADGVRNSSHKYIDSFEQMGDNGGIGKIGATSMLRAGAETRPNPLGRNKRTVWTINTQPYSGAHFATYPEALCRTPILAGCPLYICSKCGKPRMKLYKTESNWQERKEHGAIGGALDSGNNQQQGQGMSHDLDNTSEFIGWSDCGCGAEFVPGVVLDPFGGSGTTASVAKNLGRKSICIEISDKYCKLALKRIEKTQSPLESL